MAYYTDNETQSLTRNSCDNQAYLNSLTEEIQRHVDDLIQREIEILNSQEAQNGDHTTTSMVSSLSPVPSETPADVPTSGNNSANSADIDNQNAFSNGSPYNEYINELPFTTSFSTECQITGIKQKDQQGQRDDKPSRDVGFNDKNNQSCSKEFGKPCSSNKFKNSDVVFENNLIDSDGSDDELPVGHIQPYPRYQSRLPACYQESIMVTPSHSSCNSPRFNDPIRDHLIIPEPIPYVNWLIPSILACVCCFCPIGLFAVINAVKANKAAEQGYMDIAAAKAIKARKLITLSIIVGFTTGFVIGIIFILYQVG